MDTLKITIEEAIPMERVGDILCTMWETSPSAAEWAECVDELEPTTAVELRYRWEYPQHGGSLTFKDKLAEGEDAEKTYVLDRNSMKRGFEVMARDYPQHWADFRKENEDSITADVWLQCALFGEVIYG